MAYVAVSGGREAIEASIHLLDYDRGGTPLELEPEALRRSLVDFAGQVLARYG